MYDQWVIVISVFLIKHSKNFLAHALKHVFYKSKQNKHLKLTSHTILSVRTRTTIAAPLLPVFSGLCADTSKLGQEYISLPANRNYLSFHSWLITQKTSICCDHVRKDRGDWVHCCRRRKGCLSMALFNSYSKEFFCTRNPN